MELIIRPFAAGDLGILFNEDSHGMGEDILARQERGEAYLALAEQEGEIVGRTMLDFQSHIDEGCARLWAAHVREPFRSQGIGRALFAHLEDVCLSCGVTMIRLEVEKPNYRARALYERLGYQLAGEETRTLQRQQGQTVTEVEAACYVMRKQLM